MKLSVVLFFIISLTGCGSLTNSLAELTGLSFLHDRRSSAVIALDERIEDSAIIDLHAFDDIKKQAHFNVTSYNAKVLVTGEAESAIIRDKIIANIRIISGVRLVHNEMVIAPISTIQSRSEDALITIKVKDALTKIKGMPGFDATRVKVVTERKVVYLMGVVHEEEGLVAAKAVQNVLGVSKIVTVFEYIDYAKNN